MHEKAKELLKKLGVSAETIALFTDETKKEELEALKVSEVISKVDETYKSRFENDEGFLSPIQTRIRGQVLGSKQRNIEKLVPELTKEEIDALPEATRFDSMLELAIEKIASRNNGKKVDENELLKAAKAEAAKWEAKAKDLEEVEIPKIKNGFESTLQEREILDYTKNILTGKKDSVIGNVDFLSKSALNSSKEKYLVKLVDGKPKLYQKPKNETDDLLEAYDGNNPLTLEKHIDGFLTENQLIRASNAGEGGSGGSGGSGNTAQAVKYNLPGLAAAEANVNRN